MVRVFISYRRNDSATLATLLAKELQRSRISAFVDTRSLDGGGPFPDRLRRAIAECQVFVCLLGATTLDSKWVREEIAYAHQLNKVMIPVFQERYVPPDPIPDDHVYALLQSDGIKILDVQNVYVDQAIADLKKMIARSIPWRSPRAVYIAAALVVIIAGIYGLTLVTQQQPRATNTPQATVTTAVPATADDPTATDAPTDAPIPTATAPPTTAPTDVPTLSPQQLALTPVTRNADWTPYERDFDGVTMVLVPAGCFMMGSEDGYDNEKPVHEQCFDTPFWIDKYEVTNAQYKRCVDAGQCAPPQDRTDYDDPADANHPVVYVDWSQAQAYAGWRGGALPTEREWEYAARGPDALVYPWGNEFIGDNVVYSGNSGGAAAAVGSRPAGISWVGALDMSGNVWEWVSSIYRDYPYQLDDGREDMGRTDVLWLVRGGSFSLIRRNARAASRSSALPTNRGDSIGFRVVVRPPSP